MWSLGLAGSAVITVAFLAVAALLGLNLRRSGHWRKNPLGLATVALYVTCGGGHAIHTLQLLEPSLGLASAPGLAARVVYGDWHMWLVDGATAIAGVAYWASRRRFPDLVSGAAVFEDLRVRQQNALEIHDNVVQALVRAKMELALGRDAEGEEALRDSLESAKRIITGLLGEEVVRPGALRREAHSRPGGDDPG